MKILVVRYRFIGDTILTIPFLRNLRRAYPYAKIDMLVSPVSGDLLETCPYIDNLIYFDTTRKHRYEQGKIGKKSFWHYVKLLRNEKYDKAYVLKRSVSSALLCSFAGIKSRVGFDTEGRGFLLTKKVPYDKNKHEVESFLDVLKADNVPVFDNYLELWLKNEDIAEADRILAQYESGLKKVVVHATSGNRHKQWKKEYFAQVIQKLINEKDVQVYHLGANSDKPIYDEIRALIDEPLKTEPINLCGKLDIGVSAAIIGQMDLVFGNDSGTLHLAGALDVPTIVIYGPMDYQKWRVWNTKTKALSSKIPCYPCNLKIKCKNDYKCLTQITPNIALSFIDEALNNRIETPLL